MLPVMPFTVDELAFFQVPREWREITKRFGKQRGLAQIVEADCEGGRGLLTWCRRTKTWRLTDAGRAFTRGVAAA